MHQLPCWLSEAPGLQIPGIHIQRAPSNKGVRGCLCQNYCFLHRLGPESKPKASGAATVAPSGGTVTAHQHIRTAFLWGTSENPRRSQDKRRPADAFDRYSRFCPVSFDRHWWREGCNKV